MLGLLSEAPPCGGWELLSRAVVSVVSLRSKHRAINGVRTTLCCLATGVATSGLTQPAGVGLTHGWRDVGMHCNRLRVEGVNGGSRPVCAPIMDTTASSAKRLRAG